MAVARKLQVDGYSVFNQIFDVVRLVEQNDARQIAFPIVERGSWSRRTGKNGINPSQIDRARTELKRHSTIPQNLYSALCKCLRDDLWSLPYIVIPQHRENTFAGVKLMK